MTRIGICPLWFVIIIFASFLLVGAQNAMAVSFDYYSDIENPPVRQHAPLPHHIKKELNGKFGKVHLWFPVELAKKGLDSLQASITVETLVNEPIKFMVEKYELTSEFGPIELYPQFFNRQIKKGEMTASEARMKLWQTVHNSRPVRDGGASLLLFGVKDYKKPFKNLTLKFRVKIMYQGQEEIIEDSIPLYRGRYTFGFFEYLKGQFYE